VVRFRGNFCTCHTRDWNRYIAGYLIRSLCPCRKPVRPKPKPPARRPNAIVFWPGRWTSRSHPPPMPAPRWGPPLPVTASGRTAPPSVSPQERDPPHPPRRKMTLSAICGGRRSILGMPACVTPSKDHLQSFTRPERTSYQRDRCWTNR